MNSMIGFFCGFAQHRAIEARNEFSAVSKLFWIDAAQKRRKKVLMYFILTEYTDGSEQTNTDILCQDSAHRYLRLDLPSFI